MRGMALERLPSGDGTGAELVLSGDHLPRRAVGADPDRQGEPVVALLADHPVAHVSQPVELALFQADPLGQPRDLTGDACDRLAERVHGDEPLVDETEDELRPAAPADRVAVEIALAGD